jgi:GTP-binding protein
MVGFVDECGLNVRGGDGGAGCVSFRREAHVSRGGPDGGDGGKGGDVWLLADRNVASLLAFRDHPHRRAGDGKHGVSKTMHGSRGADLEVHVPEGTVVKLLHTGDVLADLVHHGDRFLAAAGGRGGKGNARFLSNRMRAPTFAEQGEHGEERWLKLELKLMADVALVGFPNAGKSTFISAISAAKPKIADYPFTTLEPHLGVVRYDDVEIVVADVPGLIEGASEGRGLGHRFLRHVVRCRALVLVVDLSMPDPGADLDVLRRELAAYDEALARRPAVVVGTKADLVDEPKPPEPGALVVSAMTGEGIEELASRLGLLAESAADAAPARTPHVVLRPGRPRFTISREGAGFRVTGRDVERWVLEADLEDEDTVRRLQRRLVREGVERQLAAAGARHGDEVLIADKAFEFLPESGKG